MSQHQLDAVDQAPETDSQHFDGLTLDKQVVKDLQVSDDDQVHGGNASQCPTSSGKVSLQLTA